MFKYSSNEIDVAELKKYCVKNVIRCGTRGSHVILDLDFNNEDGFGWLEGEGMLSDLLPLYDEIKSKNYQFLSLLANVSRSAAKPSKSPKLTLSDAQKAFFKYAGIDHKMICL